jgi:DNA-binding SARP family transcriptional activator
MELRAGDRHIHLGGPKQRALLAALVLHHGRVVGMDQLVDVLWDERPPATAVTKVQGHVCAVRKALDQRGRTAGISALETRAPGYVLRREPVATDLTRFGALRTAAAAAREQGDRHRAAALLAAGLGLWRGRPFADVPSRMIRSAAERLAEHFLTTAEDKAEIDLSLGRHRQVLDELGVLIEQHPLRDRLRELQLRALVGLDRPDEALASYQDWRRLLRRELGVEPGRRVQQLVAAIGERIY